MNTADKEAQPELTIEQTPTIAEAEKFIRKMDACSSIGAKLILLRNFLAACDSYGEEFRPSWQPPLFKE